MCVCGGGAVLVDFTAGNPPAPGYKIRLKKKPVAAGVGLAVGCSAGKPYKKSIVPGDPSVYCRLYVPI